MGRGRLKAWVYERKETKVKENESKERNVYAEFVNEGVNEA